MIRIREAAVAGSFYPASPAELEATVRRLLDHVPVATPPSPPVALIVPHAGYRYSGAVAAAAYARLAPHRDHYRRVALFGPSHFRFLDGLAASAARGFRTPLGEVAVDRDALDRLAPPTVVSDDGAHLREHSLEVQLPFLQVVLRRFGLLPFAVGRARPEQVAAVIRRAWSEPGTLVIVSSDLSHGLDGAQARRTDRATCAAIEALQPEAVRRDGACGAAAVRGLLLAAKQRGLQAETLSLCHSGDVTGDDRQVVGYGAWMFREAETCSEQAA